jgi:hypothetical protein
VAATADRRGVHVLGWTGAVQDLQDSVSTYVIAKAAELVDQTPGRPRLSSELCEALLSPRRDLPVGLVLAVPYENSRVTTVESILEDLRANPPKGAQRTADAPA